MEIPEIMQVYYKAYQEICATYYDGKSEEAVKACQQLLEDPEVPRLFRIRILLLQAECMDDWHETEDIRKECERLWRTGRRFFSPPGRDVVADQALQALRESLDSLRAYQERNYPIIPRSDENNAEVRDGDDEIAGAPDEGATKIHVECQPIIEEQILAQKEQAPAENTAALTIREQSIEEPVSASANEEADGNTEALVAEEQIVDEQTSAPTERKPGKNIAALAVSHYSVLRAYTNRKATVTLSKTTFTKLMGRAVFSSDVNRAVPKGHPLYTTQITSGAWSLHNNQEKLGFPALTNNYLTVDGQELATFKKVGVVDYEVYDLEGNFLGSTY